MAETGYVRDGLLEEPMSELLWDEPDELLEVPQEEPRLVSDGGREHFVPIRKAELVRRLVAEPDLTGDARTQFGQLCRLLEATFHFQYHQRLEQLKDRYVAFDPDRGAPTRASDNAPEAGEVDGVFDAVMGLMERANYQRVPEAILKRTLTTSSAWGVKLRVDFDVYERLEVFVRGNAVGQRTVRRWWKLWRRETFDVPTYQRLVVMFRLRDHKWIDRQIDTDPVYLKLFKNIPKLDLEMLLPGTKVRMTLLDQGRIMLPAVSGVAITVYKVIKGALALAFAGIYGVLAFLGLLGGTLGYGLKSFLGYLRARDKYHLNLTKNLYYQNLDNNAGVLFRLLDEAEEQEFIEAALAYFLLWRRSDASGWTAEALDRAAERYLEEAIGIDVDFEVHDAVRKLARLGIVQTTDDGRFVPVPIDRALRKLDAAWDSFFAFAPQSTGETAELRSGAAPPHSQEAA